MVRAPANNQCFGCGLFTTSPTGYCQNCTDNRGGSSQGGSIPGARHGVAEVPVSSDSVIIQRPAPMTGPMTPYGLKRLRTDSEIERTEHPDQRIVLGDANIRFGGRDPDIFDRIYNLCQAMTMVADELRLEVKSTFVAGPIGESTAITRPVPGQNAAVAGRRGSLVKVMQIISDDMKKFSQKDEETWRLIRRIRNLSVELETFIDMGGEARSLVRGLREMSGDLQTHVERRRGF